MGLLIDDISKAVDTIVLAHTAEVLLRWIIWIIIVTRISEIYLHAIQQKHGQNYISQ